MHKTSAWPLAAAYILLVVYASLYPFTGWRNQEIAPWEFLFAGWPKYWTGFDVATNVVGYIPLGFLLALSFLRRGSPGGAAVSTGSGIGVAALAASVLSFAMEALQTYLPARVPSNLDFGLNTLGALLGAIVAASLELS